MCPQCQGTFTTQFLCPNCGIQLLELSDRSTMRTGGGDDVNLAPTGMATRFIAGLLLAQGSYYGLRLLGAAFFRILGEPDGWTSTGIAGPGLMVLTGLAGAILAGAGNGRGLAAGAAVGLFHSVALIGVELFLGHSPARPLLFGGWLIIVLLGAIAGRYGRAIWPPLEDIHDPTPLPARAAPSALLRKPREPIAWIRIVAGAVGAAAGTVLAGRLREYIIGTSGGAFTANSRIQIHLVTWIIAALAMAIGGGIAGAATRSGLKHGLMAAIPACIGVFLIQTRVLQEALPAERFFAAVVGLDEANEGTPPRIGLFLITNSLLLATFGGWFGSALLPRTTRGPSRLDRGAI